MPVSVLPSRRTRRRLTAFVLGGALVAGVVVGSTRDDRLPAAVAAAPVAEAADEATAMAAAQRQGSRVEVASLASESSRVYANPAGNLTLEQSVLPERVRTARGWVGVDTDLRPDAEGTLTPKATTPRMTFSSGGTTLLARIEVPAGSLELTWPQALPAPTVADEVATYAEVLPGVDLRVRAHRLGFGHELVVKTPEAAANPELRRITLGLRTQGVTLTADGSGALVATGASGTVFSAPPATMWDTATGEDAVATTKPVDVEVGPDHLTLVPDAAMLADPAVRFPLVIDPTFSYHTPWQAGWTLVRASHPNNTHWNLAPSDDDTRVKGVGRVGKYDGYLDRSLFRFDTTPIKGAVIESATFRFYQSWKYLHTCDANQVDPMGLYLTGPIAPGTTWNNQPGWGALQSKIRSTPKIGGLAGCPPDWQGMNAHNAVQTAADGHWNDVTLGLRADDEGTSNGRKRLYVQDWKDPRIEIVFNRRPLAPAWVNTDPPVDPCHLCDGARYVSSDSINLATQIDDPDGGHLRTYWRIDHGDGQYTRDQWLPANSHYKHYLDLKPLHGRTVTWTVHGNDDRLWGPEVAGPSFIVDRVAPDKAPVVSSVLYPEDNAWHGGVGVRDKFTFASGGVSDVNRYLWGFSDPPSTVVNADTLGGSVSVDVVPPKDGPVDVFVQTMDRAGNRGPVKTYHFYVRPGNGAASHWAMDGNTKDSAYLGNRDATAIGAIAYGPGAVGSAMQVAGDGASMTAPSGIRTDGSFTASAWVKLGAEGQTRTAVSRSGQNTTAFTLGYQAGRWAFGMQPSDTAGAQPVLASSENTAELNTWTHLTGVYDAPTRQMSLYVNGTLSNVATTGAPWNATGWIQIGRTATPAGQGEFWTGGIDEVVLHDRALTEPEIAANIREDNVQAGHWKFDETGGSTAVNAVEGGSAGVLANGAAFDPAGPPGMRGAVRFDGNDDEVVVPGPVVATDRSFTVAAWMKLDQAAPNGHSLTAVSQAGNGVSTFFLGARELDGGSVWELYTTKGDPANREGDSFVRSPAKVGLGAWTHVTGVYDATANQIRIYVGGELAATAPATVGAASGVLKLGRGLWNGSPVNAWAGKVDDLRMFSRAVSAEEIRGIVTQDGVPSSEFPLDGSAKDADGNDLSRGGVTWSAGQSANPDPNDLAVTLDGVDDHIAAKPVVDTSRTFSVAAWVKVNQARDGWGSVVSQNGTHTSAFNLAHTGSSGKWAFTMHGPDAATLTEITRVHSAETAQQGVWTHLAASYDAQSGAMRLYVNGVLSGTGSFSARWNATGEFDIGRARWYGQWVDQLPGTVDDVRTYNRILFDDEIRRISGRDLSLVHNLRLDEPTGSPTVADAVGGQTGTLRNGANLTPGRTGNAVALDGVDDAVSTAGSAVDTRTGFTVSAWVKLNTATGKVIALSQDGSRASKFRLGFEPLRSDCGRSGCWVFSMPESDTDAAPVTEVALTRLDNEVGKWTHLVGVYDAVSKQTWLYVNGSRRDLGTLNTPWAATGGLQIGRAKVAGAYAQHWPGMVDDVRMFRGALTDDRISDLFRSYPPQAAPASLPAADRGHWKLDEPEGPTRADFGPHGFTATVSGTVTRDGGRSDASVRLHGTGHLSTAQPVLDTARPFTVSAWAYLTDAGADRTVVTQNGTRTGAFRLRYHAATATWAVVVPKADADNVETVLLTSARQAIPHEWAHLTASWDGATLRLYVNGLLSAQVGAAVVGSTGPFVIGRGQVGGAAVEPFIGALDEIRAFGRALTDGEVRAVYDDVPAAPHGDYRFDDDTAQDSSWRANHATKTASGTSFTEGAIGRGMRLDGASGAAVTPAPGMSLRTSFTASAWVKLDQADRTQTVLAQDGTRMSGFVLQYRHDAGRWVFGVPTTDDDTGQLVFAESQHAPAVGEWTHLTGVYDYGAQQLRLYVDGALSGSRDNVISLPVSGPLTLGRGLWQGQRTHFLGGVVDEARIDIGMVGAWEISWRGKGYPLPVVGQLGRYLDASGDHLTASTSVEPAAGYRFERGLGMLVGEGPNTAPVYSCKAGADGFASTDPACEGATPLGLAGRLFSVAPTNIPTVPVYRCRFGGADRSESHRADCEGGTVLGLLGHAVGYAPLVRHFSVGAVDHLDSLHGVGPSYGREGLLGYVRLVHEDGTIPLQVCADGRDHFLSTDPACEGKVAQGPAGELWTQPPPGVGSVAIQRCRTTGGERFTSIHADCEGGGNVLERVLGYLLTDVPAVEPVFPAAP